MKTHPSTRSLLATLLVAGSGCLALVSSAPADVIVSFPFTSGSADPTSELADTSSTAFTRGPGLDADATNGTPALLFTNNRAEFRPPFSSNSQDTNLSNGEFGFFETTPDSGFSLNLTSLTFTTARAGSSPDQIAVFFSFDDGATTSLLGEVSANSSGNFDLSPTGSFGTTFQGIDDVRFIFVPNGNNATSTDQSRFVSVDSIVLNGSVVPEPTTFAMLLGGVGMLIGFRRFRRAA